MAGTNSIMIGKLKSLIDVTPWAVTDAQETSAGDPYNARNQDVSWNWAWRCKDLAWRWKFLSWSLSQIAWFGDQITELNGNISRQGGCQLTSWTLECQGWMAAGIPHRFQPVRRLGGWNALEVLPLGFWNFLTWKSSRFCDVQDGFATTPGSKKRGQVVGNPGLKPSTRDTRKGQVVHFT